SGGSSFHGAVFEFHRDDALTATQWGAAEKSPYKRNNFGANIGGPVKVPILWSSRVKSYFYFNFEGFRQVGGSNQPTLSIPAILDSILGNSNYYMGRYDLQIGNKDHAFLSVWHQRAPAKFNSTLPQPIANETYSDPQNSWVSRFNYDRAFSSNLLNHMSMGYL